MEGPVTFIRLAGFICLVACSDRSSASKLGRRRESAITSGRSSRVVGALAQKKGRSQAARALSGKANAIMAVQRDQHGDLACTSSGRYRTRRHVHTCFAMCCITRSTAYACGNHQAGMDEVQFRDSYENMTHSIICCFIECFVGE